MHPFAIDIIKIHPFGREMADGQRLRGEMRVFPPQVQQSLRTKEATTLMRVSGESVAGTKWKTQSRSARPRKIWKILSGNEGMIVT